MVFAINHSFECQNRTCLFHAVDCLPQRHKVTKKLSKVQMFLWYFYIDVENYLILPDICDIKSGAS